MPASASNGNRQSSQASTRIVLSRASMGSFAVTQYTSSARVKLTVSSVKVNSARNDSQFRSSRLNPRELGRSGAYHVTGPIRSGPGMSSCEIWLR